MDGTHLTPTCAGNRLKRVFTRQFREETVPEAENEDGDDDDDGGNGG